MAQVTRKDRNRRGGNKSSSLPSSFEGDGIVHYTPVERKFLKRNGRKAMRKQHAKAIAMALNEAIEDSRLDAVEYFLEDEWYDDTPMEEPLWCDTEIKQDPYWYGDDYGYANDDLFDVDVYPTIN